MFDPRLYRNACSELRPSEEKIEEMIAMTANHGCKKKIRHPLRRLIAQVNKLIQPTQRYAHSARSFSDTPLILAQILTLAPLPRPTSRSARGRPRRCGRRGGVIDNLGSAADPRRISR